MGYLFYQGKPEYIRGTTTQTRATHTHTHTSTTAREGYTGQQQHIWVWERYNLGANVLWLFLRSGFFSVDMCLEDFFSEVLISLLNLCFLFLNSGLDCVVFSLGLFGCTGWMGFGVLGQHYHMEGWAFCVVGGWIGPVFGIYACWLFLTSCGNTWMRFFFFSIENHQCDFALLLFSSVDMIEISILDLCMDLVLNKR
ncbi:hypothetical protein B0T21DRAFT_200286 [Apiosordaria backusii]|uniref:Transmembrane protein n=1 Tax=Apiosordaria backusii TaxID=314023 RepID=A0AA40BF12_9PEZI|nr:hypothetical protein B0T21DRAFT_200286 [Apiosordaria backusii]